MNDFEGGLVGHRRPACGSGGGIEFLPCKALKWHIEFSMIEIERHAEIKETHNSVMCLSGQTTMGNISVFP